MSSGLNGSVDPGSYKKIADWSILSGNVGTITGIIGIIQANTKFVNFFD